MRRCFYLLVLALACGRAELEEAEPPSVIVDSLVLSGYGELHWFGASGDTGVALVSDSAGNPWVLLVATGPLRVAESFPAPTLTREVAVAGGVVWLSGGSELFGLSADGSWDTSIAFGERVLLSAEGDTLWILAPEKDSLFLWDGEALRPLGEVSSPDTPKLLVSVGDNLVVFGNEGGVVLTHEGDSIGFLHSPDEPTDGAGLGDGVRVAAYTRAGVRVWSLNIGELGLLVLDTLVGPRTLLAPSPDGELLYASASSGFVVWESSTLDQVAYIRTPRGRGGPLAPIPDGLMTFVENVIYQYAYETEEP